MVLSHVPLHYFRCQALHVVERFPVTGSRCCMWCVKRSGIVEFLMSGIPQLVVVLESQWQHMSLLRRCYFWLGKVHSSSVAGLCPGETDPSLDRTRNMKEYYSVCSPIVSRSHKPSIAMQYKYRYTIPLYSTELEQSHWKQRDWQITVCVTVTLIWLFWNDIQVFDVHGSV